LKVASHRWPPALSAMMRTITAATAG
jgi:hypothetical protein